MIFTQRHHFHLQVFEANSLPCPLPSHDPQSSQSIEAIQPLHEAMPRFFLTRILGNDLPPRHFEGSALRNLRFILESEPSFADCEKSWIVNRIVDAEAERKILSTLDRHGQTYLRIPFNRDAFSRRETTEVPSRPWRRYSHQRARIFAERKRIGYIAPINAARNLALCTGRHRAEWILPFDGSCYLTSEAWQSILDVISRNSRARYISVPMLRLSSTDVPGGAGNTRTGDDEPQLMFHREATQRFDCRFFYGRRDKAELLYRLRIPGGWDHWRSDPWDFPLRRVAVDDGAVRRAGWVL